VRKYNDWLKAYVDYASFSEAPKRMHFWSGVSAIAGALRRRVWLDMAYFKWVPNFYIVMVAPPGIVSKSTTIAVAMDLLRAVPGINFGPQVVTWPSLVTAFASCNESFPIGDEFHSQSAMTLESSEFGNLVNPSDRDMIDLLVTLWDSKQGSFKKMTKTSGEDLVENPWINLIACTTPAWIAGNFPEYVIGGGFTSRCLFVYTDTKERLVPYPHLDVPKNLKEQQAKLIQDLEHISINLVGPYSLTKEAISWGEIWYKHHYTKKHELLDDDRFGGYIARKQTHIHKLAMVLAASQRDELRITDTDLALANEMVTDLEKDMPKVFSRIGRSEESIHAERFIRYIQKNQAVPYEEAYRYIHLSFPGLKSFEDVVAGAIRSGYIRTDVSETGMVITAVAGREPI
jgi:hypothetical protein